jgi:hypothetical protein
MPDQSFEFSEVCCWLTAIAAAGPTSVGFEKGEAREVKSTRSA